LSRAYKTHLKPPNRNKNKPYSWEDWKLWPIPFYMFSSSQAACQGTWDLRTYCPVVTWIKNLVWICLSCLGSKSSQIALNSSLQSQ
jgi:hypothetical protein